jgi:hypothetical protein
MKPLVGSALLISIATIAGVANCQETTTAKEVLDAWVRRSQSITAFEATYSLEKVVPARGNGRNDHHDPFGSGKPANEVRMHSLFTISFVSGKRAYRSTGNQLGVNRVVDQRFDAVFDGKSYKTLLTGEVEGVGLTIPKGSLDHAGAPGNQVTINDDQIAIWLWSEPADFLRRQGCVLGELRIAGNRASSDDHIVEASFARGSSDWQLTLHLDRKKEFAPKKWTLAYKGDLRQEIDITYRDNPSGIDFVSGWVCKQYDANGQLQWLTQGTAKDATVNGLIKETFLLTFPAGTHLYEDTDEGRKYYIQGRDEKLIPIPESEYGKLPQIKLSSTWSPVRALLLGANVAVVVAVAYLVITRRKQHMR